MSGTRRLQSPTIERVAPLHKYSLCLLQLLLSCAVQQCRGDNKPLWRHNFDITDKLLGLGVSQHSLPDHVRRIEKMALTNQHEFFHGGKQVKSASNYHQASKFASVFSMCRQYHCLESLTKTLLTSLFQAQGQSIFVATNTCCFSVSPALSFEGNRHHFLPTMQRFRNFDFFP